MATLNRTFSVKNGIDVANTVVLDSNRNASNLASVNANSFFTDAGLDVTLQANTARNQANSARDQANTARDQANTARDQANSAYGAANTSGNTVRVSANSGSTLSNKQLNFANSSSIQVSVTDSGDGNANIVFTTTGAAVADAYAQANAGYAQANTARDTANAAYGEANTAHTQADDARAQANTARDQANTARDTANTSANTVRVSANGSSTLSKVQLNFVNTASIQVTVGDASDGNANISFTTTGAAVADAYAQANAGYAQANTARDTANSAYDRANAAYSTANAKIETLNAAGAIDISSGVTNNVVSYTINVNRATTSTVGVTKLIDAVNSNDTGNAATANAVSWTYEFANTMLPKAGGTVSGDLTVQGNLYLTGNATYINVATLKVNDSIIQLSTNSIADAVDIGFTGHYSDDGGTTNLHAGFIRHASDNVFYVFDGYGVEPTNNVIDIASANLAWFRANVNASTLLVNGAGVALSDTANAAYGQANTARDTANDAYAQANSARGQANTAYGQANDAFSQANSARGQANTAYGQANDAFSQANAAYDRANTKVSKSGDTMTGGLTITTSGIGLSVANANVTYSLQVGTLNVTTNTVTTAASGQVVLDKFPATQLASVKYFVQANNGSDYHTTEVVLVQDSTNVWLTEYGSIQTGPSLGTFTADIDSGDVRLLFTAVNNVNTIRSVRYGIVP